ncbi:MAG: tripartite tricarboxylate transporter substrate-binding protein [Candidatus Heteroscillospira sp.]|jgi:putative tricarboxylic transport membrane protein
MKTRIWSMLIALVLCFAMLAGCGGNSQNSASPESKAPESQAPQTQAPSSEEPQGWVPEKDIELTVGNSAGGGADLFARKVVEIIQKYNMCPVNITVVNKPGSSHVVGFTYLVETGGDYNINVVSSSFYSQPVAGNSPLTFDDFSYVALVAKDPSLLVASVDSGFKSMEDVVAYAKEHPGELSFAGSSAISDDAILWAQLCEACDVDITYVAMESGGDVLANVMGGHVQLGAMSPGEIGDNLAAGKLTAISIAADERFEQFGLQDTPTFKEQGYEINHQQHRGFVMAADAAPEAVRYYSDLIEKVYETDEWKEFMDANCMTGFFKDCDEYKEYNQTLIDTYTEYIAIVKEKQGA